MRNKMTNQKFILGSSSQIKIEALTEALEELKIKGTVISVSQAKSNVNEQPVGEIEIMTGAVNRVYSAYKLNPTGNAYIAIENGIEYKDPDWVDYAVVLLYMPNGLKCWLSSEEVIFPTKLVEITKLKGFNKNTVGETMQEFGFVSNSKDPHVDLCGITRKEIIKKALINLISIFFSKSYTA